MNQDAVKFDRGDAPVNNYDKKYDVAVVGYGWAHNYGAVLTNYGFMKHLQSLGLNPLMVEKPRDFNNKCYYDIVYSDNFARRFNERQFPENISRIYDDKNDMRALNSLADTFIIGSDQTLRYDLHVSGHYYIGLDFVNDDKKKIAYSSGMGHYEYMGDEWHRLNMRYYLSKFDDVAVREPNTVYVCKEQFDIDAVYVVDPMYFITAEDYGKLAEQSTEPLYKDYIVAFLLIPAPAYKKQLDILSEKLGVPVVVIAQFWEVEDFRRFGFENVIAPEVEGWINHIKNARLVVTDSFHAMYAIITMQKPFLFVINNNTSHKRGLARFPIFTTIAALQRRFLYSIDALSSFDGVMDDIDWESVHSILDKQTEYSKTWLKNALAAPHRAKPNQDAKLLAILHEKTDLIYRQFNEAVSILNEKTDKLCRQFSESATKNISEYDFMLLLNKNALYRQYLRYKLLSKITFGKKRKRYKEKRKILHSKVKQIREIVKKVSFR